MKNLTNYKEKDINKLFLGSQRHSISTKNNTQKTNIKTVQTKLTIPTNPNSRKSSKLKQRPNIKRNYEPILTRDESK